MAIVSEASAILRRVCAPLLFIIFDYLAILLAERMAFGMHDIYGALIGISYHVPNAYLFFWIPLVFIAFLAISQTYTKMRPIIAMVQQIFYAVLYALITCILILYFMQASMLASRLYVILFGVLALFNIYVERYVLLKFLKTTNMFMKPVILIGAGKTAEIVLQFFEGDLGYRYRIVGLLDDDPISEELPQKFLLLGKVSDAESIIRDSGVKTVIITAPGMDSARLEKLVAKIQPLVRDILFVPDLMMLPLGHVGVEPFYTEKVFMLSIRNNLARRRNRLAKRVFDLIATICGGFLILPILLVLAVLVGIDNKGHIIFAHRRVGQNGKLFPCYKFQTMVPNAQERLEEYLAKNPEARKEWEESFKLTNDPRVTKLGAFLRKTSLDELPQLWNVLMGDMSLVGPRPIVTKEIERYGDYIREYYMVPPGITGMWQVNGRSDTTYEERVAMDTWYVRNWSVWIDLVYLFKTVKTVFTGKGAY
ncbi:undecaprenyl-phosphate galactose phosphotransferase WbaP [Selenomonas sp. oral taxon 136]|uniref:undecaprenyl-phosphate galactose phosphotransferase WbaP n=1 Tax=Selenomonas sp. oral taxon 136 TaxID=713030 RepID=UPI00076815CA|nr:undecaprenyl-phosphate galactose phosphotransferase WbaP [Selenomonas sp. oral taxon 136]AME04178.1 UDP-phosphate galactose phosphotransferase [Selenomonas sp. oral taxon 136]